MKTILQILLILQILAQAMSCAGVKPASAQRIWNGTADTKWYSKSQTEFTITTPEQLAGLSKLVIDGSSFKGKIVKLGANIMLNDTANWQNWREKAPKNKWVPIGSDKVSGSMYNFGGATYYYFDGTFNGNGFAVSGIYVNSGSYIGLFGQSFGRIENLGVTASYIKGESYAGGLLGTGGDVSNCYSTAWVEGKDNVGGLVGSGRRIIYSYSASIVIGEENVGGLVGANWGEVSTSYFTGSVAGKENTGGLAGKNWNDISSFPYIIKNSYSTGKVAGKKNTGGLVGLNGDKGEIVNSYYDKETSGQSDEGKGVGKTTSEMKRQLTFANWDFIFNWGIDGKKNNGYPHLQNLKDGIAITSAEQLAAFSQLVGMGVDFRGKTVKLGANIMLNDTANWQNWASKSPANKWKPIGTYHNANVSSPFSGTFDGGGFAVSGIYINSKDGYCNGMFGYLDSNGTIKNLGVKASYIKSGGYVGGLAGTSEGIIDNSYSEALVEGKWIVGGLAGRNEGTISSSHFTGKVAGEKVVGGLAGENDGKIINSHFIGAVTGKSEVGGIAGNNDDFKIISNSYSAGTVTGEDKVGGIVGHNEERGSVISGYSESKVTGKDMVGGIAGHNNYNSAITNSYSAGTVTGTSKVGGLVGYSYTSTIINSYSTSNVKGDSLVGGLVGLNQYSAIIKNSYSAGKVVGNADVGGLVGASLNKTLISGSYYDKETSGQSDIGKGEGKTTANMQSKGFVDNLNLFENFISMKTWVYEKGKYPALSIQNARADVYGFFASGNGTERNPYIIKTKEQLEKFSWLVSTGNDFKYKTIKLGNHIMLNDTANWQNWENKQPAVKWVPIGAYFFHSAGDMCFNGTFDGGGFVVSGVYINSIGGDYQGLFGCVNYNGVLKNLRLTASYINGGGSVGGLAGINYGKISDVYFKGAVKGIMSVGEIAGKNHGIVTNSNYEKVEIAKTNDLQADSSPAASAIDGYFASGNGTEKNPYIIKTKKQFLDFSRLASNGHDFKNRTIKLGANIMLNDTANWQSWASKPPADKWIPIGTYFNDENVSPFNGTFDGGGFTVSGVYINSDNSNQGLFGYVGLGAALKNIKLIASYINGADCVGGLAGINDGEISYSYSAVWATGHYVVGGLAGRNRGAIINSHFSGVVTGTYASHLDTYPSAGGLAGVSGGTIINSYSSGKVTGIIDVGGLAGANWGKVSNSYSTGKVSGRESVGGLVGKNNKYSKDTLGIINGSYSTSEVEGTAAVGGLVGTNYEDGATINGSYFNGTVTGKEGVVGGIAGANWGKVSNSYSFGKVTGQKAVGGLVGVNVKYKSTIGSINNSYSACKVTGLEKVSGFVGENKGTIKGGYYDKEKSGKSEFIDGGKTTSEMKQKSTYEGWDFDKMWGISGEVNGGYPYLLNYNKGLP